MQNFDKLSKVSLFKDFSQDELTELFSAISFFEKNYKKDELIFNQREILKYIGIILNGKIAITNFDYFGNRNILAVFTENDSFGESIASLEKKSPHEIISLTESKVLWIEYNTISKSIYKEKILSNILKIISIKNTILNQKVQILSKRTTREKILEYLNIHKILANKNDFEINLNRNQMADFLALDRSNLSRELSKLKKEGIIDYSKNKFKIL
ncbi:MAG: Crp/Fnr family transcriptional regulator [Peptoniphilaceae bacterium]|uniref:Crp/Fnr family transcriptional regulator n=1 Tax=Parvimonas sp. TaxID=1944660 RepID=UPI0025EAE8B5|nr:Crp/Fnr family transcriptional regulator [Parvimonas sp.]MCI5996694.1 Crp/Fnr family transcriptional regulator [Parvimonas sp.]MDD7764923.1 Crp/Fnr family transcriptional regulator [Peptoniphilaceae bacterium]MDY3050641.1 Crp/Fnr family transcriptional regulator [Parvimonas sp.]